MLSMKVAAMQITQMTVRLIASEDQSTWAPVTAANRWDQNGAYPKFCRREESFG